MGRKVIFLDIDGVLRPMIPRTRRKKEKNLKQILSERYHNPAYMEISEPVLHNFYYDFHALSCYCVRCLCAMEDVEIVLSTSWRAMYELDAMKHLFELHKLGRYITGITPLRFNNRPKEIQTYLEMNPDVENYLIIDDIDMHEEFPEHFLLTKDHLRLSQFQEAYTMLHRRN